MTEPRLPEKAGPVEWIGPEHNFYAISGLIHCVRLPQEATLADPAPVVVMLHGWGGDEAAMWIFKQVVPKGVAIITPRAPLELGNGGYVWFYHGQAGIQPEPEQLAGNISQLQQFVASLPDLYPIAPERLVLIGFSQGAAMGNSLVLNRPELAAGVASLAGFIPEPINLSRPADFLDGLPVFIAHGSQDEIIPVGEARRSRDIYTDLGAEVIYGEYATGHKMNTQGMDDLKTWLAGVLKPDL